MLAESAVQPQPALAPPAPERPADEAQRLLALVDALAGELGRVGVQATLDTPLLDRLGIDSLGRLELALRIQDAFGVALPDDAVLLAETPRALLAAILAARDGATAAPAPPRAALAITQEAGAIAWPVHAATLLDVLAWYAEHAPQRVHATILDGDATETLRYGELARRARSVSMALGLRGVGPGDRVALMLPTGTDYLCCFLGIQQLGAIPVPIYPPAGPRAIEDHLHRQAAILANAGACAIIVPQAAVPATPLLQAAVPGLRHLLAAEGLRDFTTTDPVAPPVHPAPTDIALLQYTSGSTSAPKGVVLTHANLLANVRAIGQALQLSPRDVGVSWLPLYHDMGLIGVWLSCLYHAVPAVLLPPGSFLARPQRWLRAVSEHGGTISCAPNFAYELCATRLRDADLAGLDLSRWRVALNGAEPVSPRTLAQFAARLAPCGFRADALRPTYGLAENSVAVTMPRDPRPPRIDVVDRERLRTEQVAVPVPADHPAAQQVPACGPAIDGHAVRVVGSGGQPLAERQLGRVQFRGPSATPGYHGQPEATASLLDGEWRHTGDTGYLVDGELHVTGRVKDLIIRGGRNLTPYEIEEAVGAVEGVRAGFVAAFGCTDEARGTEKLVVVAGTRARPSEHPALREAIRAAVRGVLDGEPDDIVLVAPRAIPKTSSGKIRRADCRDRYLRGTLASDAAARADASLALQVRRARLARWRAEAPAVLYMVRGFLLLHLAKLLGALAIFTAPQVAWRRAAKRWSCRMFLRFAGIPVTVEGAEHLVAGACVAVVNHQSYLDTIVMGALVPDHFFFAPKRDLQTDPLAGPVMRRLDYPFVDRLDPRGGVQDLEDVKRRLRAGGAAVVYPEGIFYPEPGLRHFYTGAFLVAAETGVPVVPVAIRGARAVWRGEPLRLRRGAVHVSIAAPIAPTGSDFRAAVALRTAARAHIAAHCGEVDATG